MKFTSLYPPSFYGQFQFTLTIVYMYLYDIKIFNIIQASSWDIIWQSLQNRFKEEEKLCTKLGSHPEEAVNLF